MVQVSSTYNDKLHVNMCKIPLVTVELQGTLERDHSVDVSFGLCFPKLLVGSVEIRNIGIMVLGIVNFHYLGRNHRLQLIST